jgi:hypothetical protein
MPVHSIKNAVLQKFKTAIESKLEPELKPEAEKIVLAGMKLLYSDSTHGKVLEVYDQLEQQQFAPAAIANGMVGLLGLLHQASKGQMSIDALFPAASILLCYVLDDLEKMGMEVTQEVVKATVALMGQKLFDVLGQEQEGAPPEEVPQPGMAALPQGAM